MKQENFKTLKKLFSIYFEYPVLFILGFLLITLPFSLKIGIPFIIHNENLQKNIIYITISSFITDFLLFFFVWLFVKKYFSSIDKRNIRIKYNYLFIFALILSVLEMITSIYRIPNSIVMLISSLISVVSYIFSMAINFYIFILIEPKNDVHMNIKLVLNLVKKYFWKMLGITMLYGLFFILCAIPLLIIIRLLFSGFIPNSIILSLTITIISPFYNCIPATYYIIKEIDPLLDYDLNKA